VNGGKPGPDSVGEQPVRRVTRKPLATTWSGTQSVLVTARTNVGWGTRLPSEGPQIL
jgi:hypothetical protein